MINTNEYGTITISQDGGYDYKPDYAILPVRN